MKYTKDFEKWWNAGYGILDDGWTFEGWQRSRLKRIAYRAYKRGKNDKKKPQDRAGSGA